MTAVVRIADSKKPFVVKSVAMCRVAHFQFSINRKIISLARCLHHPEADSRRSVDERILAQVSIVGIIGASFLTCASITRGKGTSYASLKLAPDRAIPANGKIVSRDYKI